RLEDGDARAVSLRDQGAAKDYASRTLGGSVRRAQLSVWPPAETRRAARDRALPAASVLSLRSRPTRGVPFRLASRKAARVRVSSRLVVYRRDLSPPREARGRALHQRQRGRDDAHRAHGQGDLRTPSQGCVYG